MFKPETLKDLNQAFQQNERGFLVVEQGLPRFAVLDYETYLKLKQTVPPAPQDKILITGGAGFVGSIVARFLQKQGYRVVVFDNLSTGRRERVQNCPLVVGELMDQKLLEETIAGEKITAVMHFAASVEAEESVKDPGKYFENNVTGGLRLIAAMRRCQVGKLVFSSSAAVYGEPPTPLATEDSPCRPANPYGESKLAFEKFIRWYGEAEGLSAVSLRYFNAAGAWPEESLGHDQNAAESHLIPRILDVAAGKSSEIAVYGTDYPTPDGSCIRDYIHVLDLAEAHLLCLEKLNGDRGVSVYNVGNGAGYSVLEVIKASVEVTGRMIPMKLAPRRVGDPARLVADSSRLKRELGWRPRHDLPAILESAWRWHTS